MAKFEIVTAAKILRSDGSLFADFGTQRFPGMELDDVVKFEVGVMDLLKQFAAMSLAAKQQEKR